MQLVQQVSEVFAAEGVLAKTTEGFTPRTGQTDMALAVAQAIEESQTLVVEAGTGVGKTFSYLVPDLLSGERVLLSTATKTLQDQLFGRDLPRLLQALGLTARVALLKGRASYLCLHRMELARQSPELADRRLAAALSKVERWAHKTSSGDLAELEGLDERSAVIPLVTSTRDNCLGAQCPQFRACHVNLARREALAADLVVINHHLFFADLTVRESGMAELLPTVRVVVFDEAHQLNETGVQFLGKQLGTGQLIDYARDLLAAGLKQARGLVDWQLLASAVERAGRDLRLAVGQRPANTRLRWSGPSPEGVSEPVWTDTLASIKDALEASQTGLETVIESSPDFARLHERVSAPAQTTDQLIQACAAGAVRWVDVGAQLRLIESPLDIADAVRSRLLGTPQSQKTWIFTSATLGTDDALRWFTEPCGLEAARTLRVSSPFDYAQQASLYVPRTFPKPNDPLHSKSVAELAADAALTLGGRTLVLTTTLRALREIGHILRQRFSESETLQVLVQGELPKRQLIERFRHGNSAPGAGCLLVGSASFWEGVDIPGDALQLVVIDKLPFPPPNDPLVEARSQRLEQAGRSAFNDYFVPEAAVALKQGAGRLIRRETDSGILVVCDTRLHSMGYGRRLLAALPPMRRLNHQQDWERALVALTTASTTPCL